MAGSSTGAALRRSVKVEANSTTGRPAAGARRAALAPPSSRNSGSSLGQPVSTTAKWRSCRASAWNGTVVAGPCVQYRSNRPRTRKWPRPSARFSTLKPWNSCTLAPLTKVGTSLEALNTARGRSATAPRTSTGRTGAGRTRPDAPPASSACTRAPRACKAWAKGVRMGKP